MIHFGVRVTMNVVRNLYKRIATEFSNYIKLY